jgi:hypothetical protein
MGKCHKNMEECFGKLFGEDQDTPARASSDGAPEDETQEGAVKAPNLRQAQCGLLARQSASEGEAPSELSKLTDERDVQSAENAALKSDLEKAEAALKQVNERIAKLLTEAKPAKAIAKTVSVSKDDDAAGAAPNAKPEGLEILKAIHRGEM